MNTSVKKSAIPSIINWLQINCNEVEKYVKKLQQRLYLAEGLGDKRKASNL